MNNSLISIDTVEELQNHWRDPYLQWWAAGMPAFDQQDVQPVKQLEIKFKTKEDREAFAELFDYPLTENTHMLWFPMREKDVNLLTRYVEFFEGDKPADFVMEDWK